MKPYYEQDGITIYHGDCREVLSSLPPVDLVLTDPPYGLGHKLTGGNWGRRVGAAEKWDKLALNINDIIAHGKHAVIWGGNYYELKPTRCWFVWIKRDAVPTTASAELAWTTFDSNTKYFDCTIAETNAERNGHPTLKPLPLIKWCLSRACKLVPITTILDPFMGSGTTLVAAKELGRKAIGIELEEKYCEIAAKRLGQGVLALEFGE
jgi:site-specific DNA-methyltransferase (adenine-specific)